MNSRERKQLIKRVLDNRLSAEEEKGLLEQKPLSDYLYAQWSMCEKADALATESDRIRILNRILEKTEVRKYKRISYYAISSTAAIVLLLILLSVSLYNRNKEVLPINNYIVTTGIQNLKSVTLPDGTTVQLGPGTRLTYPESFKGKSREVILDGQAFFNVIPNKTQPFVVHTSHLDINVLGTSFEVFSYSTESKVEAVLLEGSILAAFYNKSTKENSQVELVPNQKLVYDKSTQQLLKSDVDANKYTAWRKHGILSFENESLTMIIPRLEQWYGRKIICQKDIAEQYRFTFKVRDESLERILFILGASSPIKYYKTNQANYELRKEK